VKTNEGSHCELDLNYREGSTKFFDALHRDELSGKRDSNAIVITSQCRSLHLFAAFSETVSADNLACSFIAVRKRL